MLRCPIPLRALFAFVVGGAGSGAVVHGAVETAASAAAVASAPTRGTLPNGVRYFILPHTAPRGGISLRLVVDAGSVDEHDDERGFAHFVEHMAFNGTPHHPPGTLTELFQRLGLTWGADFNADTGYTSTVYKLDLPEGRADHFGESLELLRDYADGLKFLPGEVEKEKGVVLSELRERDTANARAGKEVARLLYAGTPIADREVGGIPTQIEHATPDALRAFYRRCYQPERMTVLIVGEIDPAEIAAQISAQFGTVRRTEFAAEPVAPGAPLPPAGVQAHIVVNPASEAVSLSFTDVRVIGPTSTETRRAALVERVATGALQRRLQERREKVINRFGAASADRSTGVAGRFLHHNIEVQTSVGRWTEAIDFAETELRRARSEGFSEAEIKEAAAGVLTQIRNRSQAFSSLSAQQLAGEVTYSLVAQRPWRAPADDLEFAGEQLATLAVGETNAAIDAMFPPDRFHIIVRVPRAISNGAALAVAAYRKSAQLPLPAAVVSNDELRFRYEDFGPPGEIAAKKHDADLGIDLAALANGVLLNLRPSPFEPQRFRLCATLGRGVFDLPKNRPGLGPFAAAILGTSDLGRHQLSEMSRLIKLHGVAATFNFYDNTCTISFAGPSTELPFALHFVTAILSDVKLDAARQPNALSNYSAMLRAAVDTPAALAQTDAIHKLSNNDPRFLPTPMGAVSRYKFEEVAEWIRRCWLHGPLEIGIVGDFSPEEILAAAAASVGTLPARSARTPPTAGELLVFSTRGGKQVVRGKFPAGAAAVFLSWPAALADDPANNRALQLAADVLMDRMRLKLREDLGATYSPHAAISRNRSQRDYGFLWAALAFEPKQASTLTDRVIALADDLAKNGATDEELARLKEPRRTLDAEQMRANAWWLAAVVASAQSQPSVLAEARSHLNGYDELTRDDVNRAARSFSGHLVTGFLVLPAADTAGTSAKP